MVNLLNEQKDLASAKQVHYSLLNFIDLLFADGNPAGIKAALEIMEIMENNLRLPMVPLTKNHYSLLKDFINNYKQL